MATILVVDDEPMVREVLTGYLERDGHRVLEAATAQEARAGLTRDPDLVLLDIMLPGESGLEILRSLDGRVPVIMLTALAEEADRILGLELGADDYVTKPFSPREVAARVRSVLRRATQSPEPLEALEIGDLRIDPAAREVAVEGSAVDLTAKEFELLHFLATSPRQVFSRQQLLEQVWDSSADWQDPATVTVHIGRIRNKIEPDPSDPKHIQTVWGVGYKFEPWPA
jgi:DNA-binding response OmpR family regulator